MYEILYVPPSPKNLVSISTLKDKGYVVTFLDKKVYIRPKGSKVTEEKVIEREAYINYSLSQLEH